MFIAKYKIFNFNLIHKLLIFFLLIIIFQTNQCFASDGGVAPLSVEKLPETPKLIVEQEQVPTQKNDFKKTIVPTLEAPKVGTMPTYPHPSGFKYVFFKSFALLVKIISFIALIVLTYLLIKNYKLTPEHEQEQKRKEIIEPKTVSEAVSTYIMHKIE